MKIFICGFSASGKSIVTKYIGQKLNLKVIHTSDLLKQIVSGKEVSKISTVSTKPNLGWYEHSDLDSKRKDDDSIDLKLDSYLADYATKEDDFIMDSWTLPYLLPEGVKIWLKVELKERIRRLSIRDKIDLEEAKNLLIKKDSFSITKFKKLYDFELGKDLSVFDYVLDTTNLSVSEVEELVLNTIKKHISKNK